MKRGFWKVLGVSILGASSTFWGLLLSAREDTLQGGFVMLRNSKLMWSLSLLVLIFFLMTFSLYADQSQGFDRQKVKLLTGAEKQSKADVARLFGEPTSTAPIQKTEEGCIELWIYTEVIMDEIVPVKTEFLYVGFDEEGYVCSAEVTEEKME